MARTVNITDKMDFDGNPKIKIRETELEVNADAPTVLKIMGILKDEKNVGTKEILGMYELLFSEKDREKVDSMKLQFKDFQMLIMTAINLVTGETEGEA